MVFHPILLVLFDHIHALLSHQSPTISLKKWNFTKNVNFLWSMKIEDSIWFVREDEICCFFEGSSNKGFFHIHIYSFSRFSLYKLAAARFIQLLLLCYTWKIEKKMMMKKDEERKILVYKCEWAHSWFLMKTKWDFFSHKIQNYVITATISNFYDHSHRNKVTNVTNLRISFFIHVMWINHMENLKHSQFSASFDRKIDQKSY